MKKRRQLTRKIGERPYKRMFVLSVEGRKTEHQYFTIFKKFNKAVRIFCLKKKDRSSPGAVLKEMKKHLKENSLSKEDEAWIIVDTDNWRPEQLKELFDWSKQSHKYGLAVSNPCFEYWLLLHFEDGKRINGIANLRNRLNKHIHCYDKDIRENDFPSDRMLEAINRAKQQDVPACKDWPRKKVQQFID